MPITIQEALRRALPPRSRALHGPAASDPAGKPGTGTTTKSGMLGPPDAKGQTGVHFNKGLPNEM
jgi:hypothetical protein